MLEVAQLLLSRLRVLELILDEILNHLRLLIFGRGALSGGRVVKAGTRPTFKRLFQEVALVFLASFHLIRDLELIVDPDQGRVNDIQLERLVLTEGLLILVQRLELGNLLWIQQIVAGDGPSSIKYLLSLLLLGLYLLDR